MSKLNNIVRVFTLLSVFIVGFLVASPGGHGGSSGGGSSSSGGGNEGGGYASLSAPPTIPPQFNPSVGWPNREPAKIAISDARKKYLKEMKKERRMLAGLKQAVYRDRRDRAFDKKEEPKQKLGLLKM